MCGLAVMVHGSADYDNEKRRFYECIQTYNKIIGSKGNVLDQKRSGIKIKMKTEWGGNYWTSIKIDNDLHIKRVWGNGNEETVDEEKKN